MFYFLLKTNSVLLISIKNIEEEENKTENFKTIFESMEKLVVNSMDLIKKTL